MISDKPTKQCTKCKQVFPATLEYFQSNRGRKDGLHSWCKICKRKDQRKYNHLYYQANHEKILERTRKYHHATKEKQRERSKKYYLAHKEIAKSRTKICWQNIRQEAISAYGKKCQCCGETQIEFLVIDHINGGGSQHRKYIKKNIFYWLRDNNYPSGFQVLCHNCNMSLGLYGYCPHNI
jgi:hypothetical protein